MAEYQVRLKDWDGAQVAMFAGTGRRTGGLRRFSIYKQLRRPGPYILEIDGDDARIELFGQDYQVEFWRRDRAGGLAWYNVFEGFHRSDEYRQDQSGHDVYVSEGRHYNDLLMAEPIRWAAGSPQASKSGAAETVAKEFVDENVGPGATSPPRDRSGVMPGLTVEATAGTGATWSGARANKNLLDVLIELADHAPGDFMVVGTGAAAFQFQWRADQWGHDKTRGNAAGLPPVIFSSLLGTAQNVQYRYSHIEEVNTVDVLGQGSGDQRRVVTVTSGAEGDSPWARRAVARDARNTYDEDELDDKGEDILVKQRARVETQVEVLQSSAQRFGRDWDLGDLVTLEYRAFSITQKIVAVRIMVDSGGAETIEAIMETP